MAKQKVARKRKERQPARPAAAQRPGVPQPALLELQRDIGNRAVQRVLARKKGDEQGRDDARAAKKLVQVGLVKIERPKIEYYDVGGSSLREVSRQFLQDGKWYQYDYRYKLKMDQGVVTRVDIEVAITLRLPRWEGASWERAPENEKLAWLHMMSELDLQWDKAEILTQLPQQWLGVDWTKAPETLKSEWRERLLDLQSQEEGHVDRAYRRALVLQQRLLRCPEKLVKAVFDRFVRDLKVEREAYDRQMRFGERKKVGLGANLLVQ
jgi:hypothetical protein